MPKILIVDDNQLDLEVLADYLAPLQATIVRAADSYEAILAAERESPDLVLVDVVLPGADGIQVLREIKASQGEEFLPVIVATAVPSADYRHAAYDAGADAFLPKPIDALDLLPLARNLLALRERHRGFVADRERLHQAQEARQLLTGALVHDLRNPITVIKSNLHFLHQELAGTDPEWRAAAAEGQLSTHRLLRMIGNILETSALEERTLRPHHEEIDLAALIGDVVQRAATFTLEHTLQARAADLPKLRGDRALLTRAVENFVDAAVRYAPAGRTLELSAELLPNARVRLCLAAEGARLPEELRRNLFQRFQRMALHAPPSARHAALALNYCRLVALAHRGEVSVAVDPGAATFAMTLPAEPPPG